MLGNGSKVEDVSHLVDKHRPDAVIMAVGLPDGDGVEAARQVMASGACPVVLLTSHTDFAVSSRAIQAGVLGFLAKPLRPEELGPALDVAVSRFRELSAVRLENENASVSPSRTHSAASRRPRWTRGSRCPRWRRLSSSRRRWPRAGASRSLLASSASAPGCLFLRQSGPRLSRAIA